MTRAVIPPITSDGRLNPLAFHFTMARYWTRPRTELDEHGLPGLGNVYTPALGDVWGQLACALNAQIRYHDDPDEHNRFAVFAPECGTGKTVGTAVALSMFPWDPSEASEDGHPGVLYMCRMKSQADEVARLVNARRPGAAFAYHSDHRCTREEMRTYPVLVITHSMFGRVSEAMIDGHALNLSYRDFTAWGFAGRKLLIIDEAFNLVEDYEVDPVSLGQLYGALAFHTEYSKRFALELEAMRLLFDQYTKAKERKRALKERDGRAAYKHLVLRDPSRIERGVARVGALDFEGMREAVGDLPLRGAPGDPRAKAKQIERDRGTLKALEGTLKSWAYYTASMKAEGPEGIVYSARTILPDASRGALILDATADSTPAYGIFKKGVRTFLATPARRYDNLRISVSLDHKTGRRDLRQHAKSIVPAFMANLHQAVEASSSVLVVCHKDVKWAFEKHRDGHGFAAFDVGTWGALDGRNDWRDFDTLAILGLPHLPRRWATGIYMALQGLQDERWLNEHQAICDELHDGYIVTELVQAIGRIRCRRVIDREGHCDTAKVLLALAGERKAKEYLAGIRTQLPGVRIDMSWGFDHAKRAKHSTSDFRGVLGTYLEALTAGCHAASSVQKAIGISRAQWFRLAAEMQDALSHLSQLLRDRGVRYRVEGKGRGARSWLVKE